MKRVLFLSLLLVVAVCTGFAQTAVPYTTLSAAVTNSANVFAVTSATNFTAGHTAYLDKEAVTVSAITGTYITVVRGQHGTKSASHASGAVIYVGPNSYFYSSGVSGSCTSANENYLPHIIPRDGKVQNCVNGQWVDGDASMIAVATGKPRICTVPVGSVAYGSFGTSTTPVDGTIYWINVEVPDTRVLTGISLLNGATAGGTNKWLAGLYPAGGGAAIANSAVAGVATSGADGFQDLPFTATYLAYPGRYWIAMQTNGNTDRLRTVAVSTFPDVLTASTTGTFGTLKSLTVPTTFTADKGPIACLY